MNRILPAALLSGFILLLDFYAFRGVKTATHSLAPHWRQLLHGLYWATSALTLAAVLSYNLISPQALGRGGRALLMGWIFAHLFSRMVLILFVLADDLRRLVIWVAGFFSAKAKETVGTPISRSAFLSKSGLIAAALPYVAVTRGFLKSAHDYQVLNRTVYLPHLPASFDGLRIAQISDIHAGSFWDRDAVIRGIGLLNAQKPDMVFFTGDLVNNSAEEMQPYTEVFMKIEAPLGVYSVLGNHDYGDYSSWPSPQAKADNLQRLKDTHKAMGWDLLVNENRIIERNGESIAVLGIENWSAMARFPKYGKLDQTLAGSEKAAVKLLLSHDPTHWRAQVLGQQPDIDIMFAGHTHGMQFGFEIGKFRWSPAQWIYKEWADLYQEAQQYLYVNRGFGYLALPGRIGILPEITLLELRRGEAPATT